MPKIGEIGSQISQTIILYYTHIDFLCANKPYAPEGIFLASCKGIEFSFTTEISASLLVIIYLVAYIAS